MALAAGDSSMKPLNPDWDKRYMDALEHGQLDALVQWTEDSIEQEAGLSAHESKTWLVARAALPQAPPRCTLRHYQAAPVVIADFGGLVKHTA